MHRLLPFLLALELVPFLTAYSQDQADPVLASRAAAAEAVRAYQAHDTAAFLRYAAVAQRLRPTHGGALYNLACARAMSGDRNGSIAALRQFADLGYTADLGADDDLASLRQLPAFGELLGALAANAAPVVRSRRGFILPERDFLPEGIAYDPRTRAFFVSSVHRRKIVRVDDRGRVSDLVTAERDSILAPLGMRVDAERGLLWVATSPMPQMARRAAQADGPAAILRVDLATGRVTGRFPVRDGREHVLGDLTLTRAGDVYASDSRGPALYRIEAGRDSLERFVQSPLLMSAQGLALAADERALYVADYTRGVLRVDLASRTVVPLRAGPQVLALGIDGLYRMGHDLIGVQNGVEPHRVVRLDLDASGDSVIAVTVLERAHPDYGEPTLGVVVDADLYYVANAQYERFGDDGTIAQPDSLRRPVVLRLPLH